MKFAPDRTKQNGLGLLQKFIVIAIISLICVLNSSLVAQVTYYSQGDDYFSITTNWDDVTTGGGNDPSDFEQGDVFVIQSEHTITMDAVATAIDSLIIESGGEFDNSSHPIVFAVKGGALDIQSGGNYTASTGTIEHQAGLLNTVTIQATAATTLYNVINNGSLTFSGAAFQIDGTFTMNTSQNITLSSASITYGSSGTLKYSSSKTVGSEWPSGGVPNLILQSGTVTISSGTFEVDTKLTRINGSLSVSGTFQFDLALTTTLEYAPSPAAAVTVGGEWPSTNGPSNVTVTNSGQSVTSSSLKQIDRTLTMTAGTLAMGSNNLTILGTISGSELGDGGTVTSSGTITMGNGGGSQFAQSITGSVTLSNLTINKAAATNDVTVTGNPIISNGLTLTAGDLVIDAGSITISSGGFTQTAGTTDIRNSGSFTVTSGDLILNGGTFSNSSGSITITNAANSISVASGATFEMTTGANSISVDEIILVSGATYKTGGKEITNLTTLTLNSNSTFEFNGTTVETTPLSSPTFGNLTMNNSGGLNINGTVTVNGIITFSQNATINTSASNMLIMGGSASFVGANADRYVNGPLRLTVDDTGNQFFPIGKSAYRPATFSWAAGTPNDVLEMEYQVTDPGGTPPSGISSISSNGHYTLVRISGSTNQNYTLEIRYTDTGFNPENRNRILIQNGAGPTYAAVASGQTHDEGNDDVTATITTGLPLVDFIVAFGAGGTTVRWAGVSDNDWHIAANWIPAAIPTSEDAVTIDSTIGVVVRITGTNEAEAASLVIGEGTNSSELILNSSGANPLTVSGELTVGNNSQLTVVDNTNAFSAGSTTFDIGSTVEYQDGNIPVDDYHDLNINGASGTTGSGTINVAGNLVKTGGAFTGVNTFDVTGVYTNTAGNATYNGGGLIVDGTPFTVTSGVVGGTIDINSTTTTVTGATGSFGGTVTFSHTAAQSVGGTGTIVFSTLEIDNGSGLTLNRPTTATSLTLTNGLINNGLNVLTLGSGSSGSSTSYVNGPVAITNATGTQTFPIGKSNFRPITTNLSSSATPTVQFEVFDVAPNYSFSVPLVHISTVRYWLGTLSGIITGGSVNVTYGPDDGVQTPSSLLMAYSADNSAAYTSLGGTGSGAPSGNITGTLSGTALGYFTLGTSASDNSLPVELSVFAAQPVYNMVTLTWVTESEIWNEGFNIYRRDVKEEDEWRLLSESMIPGQGNTSEKTTYEFVDRSVAAGQTYEYMLESISYAGVRVQEKVIEVLVPIPTEYTTLGNYPNPFNPTTNIGFRLPETSEVSILIYGIQGNLVRELALNQAFEAGDHFVTWDATDNSGQQVASGMYVYLFTAGKFKKTEKMLLLK
ncbi:MAG: T9SS type A sorting domain-containing protein [Calditrichia bacterium]|nr:T9SS type A sorting domain-containing protein [Calditrichia bacterium]